MNNKDLQSLNMSIKKLHDKLDDNIIFIRESVDALVLKCKELKKENTAIRHELNEINETLNFLREKYCLPNKT